MRPQPQHAWLTHQRALVLLLIALTGIVFGLCAMLVTPFLPALTWAVALAVVAHPLHGWMKRKIQQPNVAAGLVVGIVSICIIAPSLLVIMQLVREATGAAEYLQQQIESGELQKTLERYPSLAAAWQWAQANGGPEQLQASFSSVAGSTTRVFSGSIWTVAQLLISLFSLFFLFRDRHLAVDSVRELAPLSQQETETVLRRLEDTIYATIYGTVVVAMLQGALGGLMFWWLGLPAPLLWGVVMALLAIIPYLGAFVIWVPAAIYLASQGDWGKAALLTAWGTIVVGLIDNLVYPVLVGRRLRMHTLVAFIAIIGGISVLGMSGIVLGPVIMALAYALVDVWRGRTSGGQGAEEGVPLPDEAQPTLGG